MLRIDHCDNTEEGLTLKKMADTRTKLVSTLRDQHMIDEETFALFLKKNNAVTRYASCTEEEFILSKRQYDNLELSYKHLYAHSRVNLSNHILLKYLDFVQLQEPTRFKTLVLNSQGIADEVWDRKVDTEAKFLEMIFNNTYQSSNGVLVIDMYTKFHPCESCLGVMEQFIEEMKKYNVNAILNVYYEIKPSKINRLRKGQTVL